MSVDAAVVKARLRQMLPTVDMEMATQRSITKQLEAELGAPLSAHKPMIKEEIDTFLLQQPDFGDADSSPAHKEEEEEEAAGPSGSGQPAAKRMRGATGAPAPAPAPAGELPAALAGAAYVAQLSAKRFASVRQYNGRWMADVRDFYEGESGALQPSAKGLSLQPPAWATLAGRLPELRQALEDKDAAFFVELGGSKRASISNYKGGLDLREHYEKDGEMLPGKKGVALNADEAATLAGAAPLISQHLQAGGGGTPASGQQAKPAGGAAGKASPAGKAAAGGGAAAAAAAAAGGAGGELPIFLSKDRRADISTFKGKTYVGVREYYEKDGEQLPGKKGISLSKEQFGKLRAGAEDLLAALQRRDSRFAVDLSGSRKASVNEFKGRWSVDIREFYEKEGQQLPGKKGISLPEDQARRLFDSLPALSAALDQA